MVVELVDVGAVTHLLPACCRPPPGPLYELETWTEMGKRGERVREEEENIVSPVCGARKVFYYWFLFGATSAAKKKCLLLGTIFILFLKDEGRIIFGIMV